MGYCNFRFGARLLFHSSLNLNLNSVHLLRLVDNHQSQIPLMTMLLRRQFLQLRSLDYFHYFVFYGQQLQPTWLENIYLDRKSDRKWVSPIRMAPRTAAIIQLELPVAIANCSSADWVSIGITCMLVPRLKLDPIKSFSFDAARLTIVCLFTFRVLERTV